MKIFGICLAKNEADMIEETLRHAARWCDRIFVFDNGSADGTWEKVRALAQRQPRVVPYKSAAVPYRDSLRAEVFDRFRHESQPGDWWCKLDADELYHDEPRAFLAAVPRRHHVVWAVSFQFYFTDLDAERCAREPQRYTPDGSAEASLQHYRCDYSEARFFRYRPALQWRAGSAPRHLGVVHPRRIRLKHYQYRNPQQIELRLRTRQEAIAAGCGTFEGYNEETEWRQKVVPAASCHRVDEPNAFLVEAERIPHHLEQPWRRAAKLVLHGTGIWP